MKRLSSFHLILVTVGSTFLMSCGPSPSVLTKKYVVRRVITSGTCQVWDSQASPVGLIVGGGPFNSEREATDTMCSLRTDDPTDTTRCLNVNPENACPRDIDAQADLDLPDAVVKYLDTLPLSKLDVEQALLPNGQRLGDYRKALLARSKQEANRDLIFPTDTPRDQLSQLFTKFFTVANNFVDDSKHQHPKGADDSQPKQDGLAYNLGSRDTTNRKKMYATSCNLQVYGLDCSGLLFQVFRKSGCNDMNLTALDQSKPASLNNAISGVVSGVEARDKGRPSSDSIVTGDIVYWDKLGGTNTSHIGIVLRSGTTLFAFQSIGRGTHCEENLSSKRGPRTIPLDDAYWFGANSNWKVLRYEVQ